MSASDKKQAKASSPEETMKQARNKKLQKEEKKKRTLHLVLGSVVAIIVAGLVFWNQGIYQRNAAAITIDGTSYTAPQVQLFYKEQLYGSFYGTLPSPPDGVTYDFTIPADEQDFDASAGETWHDYFTQQAAATLAELHVYAQMAKDDGFTLPQEAEDELESIKASLNTSWIGYSTSKDSFLLSNYGMSEKDYLEIIELDLYSSYYQLEKYENFTFTQADYEAYYEENKDILDVIEYTQFSFTASIPTNYDEEGNAVDPTEDDLAQLAALEAFASINANNLVEAYEDGDSLEEIEAEYAGEASSYTVNNRVLSSSFNNSTEYGLWILDDDRENGVVTITTAETTHSKTYTVTILHSRERAEEPTVNIRHIYIQTHDSSAEGADPVPTEEQWEESYQLAEEILQNWLDDGADLDEFATLAQELSADSGSAANGGVMEGVSIFDGYVSTFADWATDPERKSGDTGIVKNEGSSILGWHIMYFDDWDLPLWEADTQILLQNESMTQWVEEIQESLLSRIQLQSGLKYMVAETLY